MLRPLTSMRSQRETYTGVVKNISWSKVSVIYSTQISNFFQKNSYINLFFWSSIVTNVCILTLCGTRKLQFFCAEIQLEFKNRPMPKAVNAIWKEIIKVNKLYKIPGLYFSSWEFWVSVDVPDTLCFKGLTYFHV